MPFRQLWDSAGCQYSNRACLANPINLLFVELMSMNLEVLSGQTQVSCSNPAPAQEYSDPPLLIGFTNLQLAGSSIYQEYFIFILLILCVVQVVSPY